MKLGCLVRAGATMSTEPFHLVHDEGGFRPERAVLAGGGEAAFISAARVRGC